jgi:hypothetical protein
MQNTNDTNTSHFVILPEEISHTTGTSPDVSELSRCMYCSRRVRTQTHNILVLCTDSKNLSPHDTILCSYNRPDLTKLPRNPDLIDWKELGSLPRKPRFKQP